jgi:hypothetical protein
VIRHAQAGERAESAAALGARDATKRRTSPGSEGALAPSEVGRLVIVTLLGHGDLPLPFKQNVDRARPSADRAQPNCVTSIVNDVNRSVSETRQAGPETALDSARREDGSRLLALPDRVAAVFAPVVPPPPPSE